MATAEELAQRALDIAGIEDDSMTWSGADYAGTLTEVVKRDSPEIGGFVREYDCAFYVRAELFSGTRPNVDDEVTIGTKTLKIVSVTEVPDDITIELKLTALSGS